MMSSDFLIINYRGSELYVVPSIHFNHVFAWGVNKICSHLDIHLEAIAVELGPDIVLAVKKWLGELGVGSEHPKELPVMLGIMKQNRMIRASLKEKVLQLQKQTGKDLSELSPDILYSDIGFSGYSVLFLSPVDSIIEAIRCGIELTIPIYGIDLEEMADSIFRPISVRDPVGADRHFIDYIAQNAPLAEKQRDEEIDCRREIAMAARLKALLQRYRRVLFVCGMAHWLEIKKLLEDNAIRPSAMPDIAAHKEYKRVVVHPNIAVKYMDLFPALAAAFEKVRLPANRPSKPGSKKEYLEPIKVFIESLNKTYKHYFIENKQELSPLNWNQDFDNIKKFEAYLANTCLLDCRRVPDIFMATQAAQDIMSNDFAQTLTEMFMNIPWASPDKFRGCDLLSPPRVSEDESGCTVLIRDDMQDGDSFFIRSFHNNNNFQMSGKIPYEWKKKDDLQEEKGYDFTRYAWLPWERLITSMSLRAMEHVRVKQKRKTETFEGSILDGIDIKSTIRSYSRNGEALYVRDYTKERVSYLDPVEGFPVVWILGLDESEGPDWMALLEHALHMESYIKDGGLFKKIIRERGDNMVATIAYGRRSFKVCKSLWRHYIEADKYQGLLIFQPLSWTHKQYAHWAELTHYRGNPFYASSFYEQGLPVNLANYYKEGHRIIIGEHRRSTALILMALPFAKDTLTVVTPDDYKIDRVVYEKAKKYGVEVKKTSLNLFSQKEIERLSLCYLVPVITAEPKCLYSKAVEKAIGELQTDNLHLIPQQLQDFGNDEY